MPCGWKTSANISQTSANMQTSLVRLCFEARLCVSFDCWLWFCEARQTRKVQGTALWTKDVLFWTDLLYQLPPTKWANEVGPSEIPPQWHKTSRSTGWLFVKGHSCPSCSSQVLLRNILTTRPERSLANVFKKVQRVLWWRMWIHSEYAFPRTSIDLFNRRSLSLCTHSRH